MDGLMAPGAGILPVNRYRITGHAVRRLLRTREPVSADPISGRVNIREGSRNLLGCFIFSFLPGSLRIFVARATRPVTGVSISHPRGS